MKSSQKNIDIKIHLIMKLMQFFFRIDLALEPRECMI